MNTLDTQMVELTENQMTELTAEQIDMISGGYDWGAVGAGAALVGLGIMAVSSGPVGWVGIGAAAASSFGGGAAIGYGLGH